MIGKIKKVCRNVAFIAVGAAGSTGLAHAGQTLTVYKSPSCHCCSTWAERMESQGFTVVTRDRQHMKSVKQEHGVRDDLASCHTAILGGYVIEGHVPAKEIRKLVKHQFDIDGLAVPGMPAGSPGMEMGSRQDPYKVVAFKDNKAGVFASY